MTTQTTQSHAPGDWLASDGNWYPPQGQSPPPPSTPKKKRHTARWVVMAAVIVVIGAAVASSSNKKSTNSSPAASNGGTPSAAAAAHKIGDTATTSGWQVTVYAVADPWTAANQLDTPPVGTRYVQVDFQIRNTKSTQQPFSSLLALKLIDSTNRSYTEAITTAQPGPPDGEVPAGQAVRGFVTFAVPTGTTGLVLQVQGSLTAAGAQFQLS
jgi:hypothetical protein